MYDFLPSEGKGGSHYNTFFILGKGTSGQILPKTKCIYSKLCLRTRERTTRGSWDCELALSQDSFHYPGPLFPFLQGGPLSLWVPSLNVSVIILEKLRHSSFPNMPLPEQMAEVPLEKKRGP